MNFNDRTAINENYSTLARIDGDKLTELYAFPHELGQVSSTGRSAEGELWLLFDRKHLFSFEDEQLFAPQSQPAIFANENQFTHIHRDPEGRLNVSGKQANYLLENGHISLERRFSIPLPDGLNWIGNL